MARRNNDDDVERFVLGSKPMLKVSTVDENGVTFIPSEIRVSIKEPDGTVLTYSGGDLTTASGYMYLYYQPDATGWHQWEAWVKDGNQREAAETRGFEVYDLVYQE